MKKRYWIPLVLIGALVLTYLLGPRIAYDTVDAQLPTLDYGLAKLDQQIAQREARQPTLKPDNESRILWADSTKSATPWAILYLHGYSASPTEGDPVVAELRDRYGVNVYQPRLAGHGIADPDGMKELTPAALVASAKRALVEARLLGDSLLIISTSTGSTLANYLAAQHPELVQAQVMYSPNMAIGNPAAPLLSGPWGLELTQLAEGGEMHRFTLPAGAEQYWTTSYHTKGIVALQNLLDQISTPAIWQRVAQPYFIGYYYKDDANSDHVISIPAIEAFAAATATPEARRRLVAFPDVDTHVIASGWQSKDLDSVRKATWAFLEEMLGWSRPFGYKRTSSVALRNLG